MVEKHSKVVWVVGASSGIGSELVKRYANEGATVIATARNQATLEALSSHSPKNIIPLAADISIDKNVESMTNKLSDLVPHIDIAILCAGVCEYVDLPLLDINSFRRVFDTNFFGAVNCVNACFPLLKKAPTRPQIVGVSSMSTFVGFPRAEAYGSSKAALTYFLNSLRSDINNKMDIVTVHPGFVKTPLTDSNDFPMPFLITAEKAADIMVTKLKSRPMKIDFPTRLGLILKLLSYMPSGWYKLLAPKLSRAQG